MSVERDLARRRVRRLRRRPAALGGAGRRGRRAGARPRLRHRPGRAAPRPRAATRCIGLDRDPELVDGARASAAGGLPVRRRASPTPATSTLGEPVRPGARADAAAPAARRAATSASPASRCVAAHLRAGRPCARSRSSRRCRREPRGRRRRRCPTCARSTAGSTRACRSRSRVDAGAIVDPPPAPDRLPDGELSEELERGPSSHLLAAETLEDEARERRACAPVGRREIPPTDVHVGSTVVLLREGALMELRLLALYPEQMNIYADRGNILFLQRRCEWRGIGFELRGAGPGERFDPAAHDLIYIGGGQDRDQRRSPRTWSRPSARRSPRRSTTAPCARGLRRLPAARPQLPARRGADAGLGLVDLETVREPGPRLIGNVAIEVDLGGGPRTVAGFENHGGRTHLGAGAAAARPRAQGPRQQRRGRLRGRPPRQPDRHLPARPAAAEERLARRPPDRARAGAPLRQPARAGAARRRASSSAAHESARRAALAP